MIIPSQCCIKIAFTVEICAFTQKVKNMMKILLLVTLRYSNPLSLEWRELHRNENWKT